MARENKDPQEIIIEAARLLLLNNHRIGFGMRESDEFRLKRIIDGEEKATALYLTWEIAFGIAVQVNVNQDYLFDQQTKTKGKAVVPVVPKIEVNWSSTSRDLVQAQAALTLYSQALAVAVLLQCRLGDTHYEAVERDAAK